MHRRELFTVGMAAISFGIATAGCLEGPISTRGNDSPEPATAEQTQEQATPTDRQTLTETGSLNQLQVDATVIQKASTSSPARIQTTLTNMGDEPVEFGTGTTLIFHHEGDLADATVILYPESYIGPNETPEEATNDCWRYTDNKMLVQGALAIRNLAPGESFAEVQKLYTVGPNAPCRPDGEYQFSTHVSGQNGSRGLVLKLTLSIGDETLQVTTSERMNQ